MNDLKEHIGTILWIAGGLLTIVGILITVIWRDLIGLVKEVKAEALKFPNWIKEMSQKGGIVTRDDHFGFCGKTREKCPIIDLMDWKDELYEKGGPMTMADHSPLCKEVIQQVSNMFCGEVTHNRELMMTELKLIQAKIEKDVVKEIASFREELTRYLKNGTSK